MRKRWTETGPNLWVSAPKEQRTLTKQLNLCWVEQRTQIIYSSTFGKDRLSLSRHWN